MLHSERRGGNACQPVSRVRLTVPYSAHLAQSDILSPVRRLPRSPCVPLLGPARRYARAATKSCLRRPFSRTNRRRNPRQSALAHCANHTLLLLLVTQGEAS